VSSFDLGHQEEQGGPRHVRTLSRVAPGESVKAVLDAQLHQGMPRWMELDFVDPVPEAVVCA
jgi:hypothetical protein